MEILAVIDTNVVVSAMLARRTDSATVKVIDALFDGKFVPVYSEEILNEYIDVLSRKKFKFTEEDINVFLNAVRRLGIPMERTVYGGDMPDPKDRVFYEVSLTGDSYLVTGNTKHFPITPKVITPAEMIKLIRIDDK